MGTYAGTPSPHLRELTLCAAAAVLTVMDSWPFARSELAVRMCRRNTGIGYSNDFMECLYAKVEVSAEVVRP